jgi:hypothetical protein
LSRWNETAKNSLIAEGGMCLNIVRCHSHRALNTLSNKQRFWANIGGTFIQEITPGEIVGGAQDGAVIVPGFSLDMQGLISAFEKVAVFHWRSQSFGPHDNLGPHVSIEGVYQGHEVWLQVLAEAPEDEEPGFKVDL